MHYTIPELVALLGGKVTASCLYALASSGKLPCVRVGRKVLVAKEAWEAFISPKQKEPTKRPVTPKVGKVDPEFVRYHGRKRSG